MLTNDLADTHAHCEYLKESISHRLVFIFLSKSTRASRINQSSHPNGAIERALAQNLSATKTIGKMIRRMAAPIAVVRSVILYGPCSD